MAYDLSSKERIKEVQRDLNARGIRGADGKPLTVDGIIGKNTRHALAQVGEGPDAPKAAAVQGGMTDSNIRNYVQAHYGYAAAYLDHPEIGPILLQAAREGWGADELRGALTPTVWWQSNSKTQREFDILQEMDPASANQQVVNQRYAVREQAKKMGITLSEDRERELAIAVLRDNWTTAQLNDALANEIHYNPTAPAAGEMASNLQEIRKLSKSYGVPISDNAMEGWLRQLATGTQTIDGFREYAINQAASMWAPFADQLRGGATLEQILDPYRQDAAQLLELTPDAIDFTQPKWGGALQVTEAGKPPRVLSRYEWQNFLRSDATFGWSKTKQAEDQVYAFAEGLAKTFGRTI